jgi:ADP-ribosylglycohydrolase
MRTKGIANLQWVSWLAYLRWLVTQGEPWTKTGGAVTNTAEPDGWLVHQPLLHRVEAPGLTCLSALRSGLMGSTSWPLNDSKGCGGVMRVAPWGAFAAWRWQPEEIYRTGVELAAITHGHPDGQHASGALAVTVAELVRGRNLAQALEVVLPLTTARIQKVITEAASLGEGGDLNPNEIEERLGAGWVGDEAYGIALAAAIAAPDLQTGLLAAVNHSGDSDSTGSICGNLLGSLFGEEMIPTAWLERLDGADLVAQVADDLVTELAIAEGEPEPDGWCERYPGW